MGDAMVALPREIVEQALALLDDDYPSGSQASRICNALRQAPSAVTLASYTELFEAHRTALRRVPQLAIPEGSTPPSIVMFDGRHYAQPKDSPDARKP